MIGRAIRLATCPARTAYRVVEEGIWLARAAVEIYGYGISISGPPEGSADNFLDNYEWDD